MSVKELDGIITLLAEKKRNMEQQESETNMQILLVFLHCLRKQKMDELNEVIFFFIKTFLFVYAGYFVDSICLLVPIITSYQVIRI